MKDKLNIASGMDEDVFEKYLEEMDKLIMKYPEDPNKIGVSEKKLNELIQELDNNWMEFRRKWENKLGNVEKVLGGGMVKKEKGGLRHLVIKSEFADRNVLDLIVGKGSPEKENKK
ncbi:MAG: hypothetical protein HY810_09825 [Candidatus Omnitrophica bacterium]|nr:hypothetical protein [Candidatus Omnitrophota bacterium]